MKKKTYMINHIAIKQVWLKKNIIFIKNVQMGGTKISREPNENKRFFIIYHKTKFQKLGSLKHERVEKT